MKKLVIFLCALLSIQMLGQGPGEPFNPMTAHSARGIRTYNHILYWENPVSVIYNKVYFSVDSTSVANLNPSSIIFDGYPTNSISELSLGSLGGLEVFKKYFWRVVEFDASISTLGPIWNFKTNFDPTGCVLFDDDFENISNEWIITNDGGTCIWELVSRFNNNYWLPFQHL